MFWKKKIFIGLDDIASQIDDWKEGFEKNGLKTLTAVKYKGPAIKKSKVDIILQEYIIKKDELKENFPLFKPRRISTRLKPIWQDYIENKYRKKIYDDSDIYFFLWTTLDDDCSDLAELKRKGKKIISLFVGDEVRWYPAMKQEFAKFGLPPIQYQPEFDISSVEALEKRLIYLRNVEKYSDMIIFLQAPTQTQLCLRPYYSLPILLRSHEIVENTDQRKVPVVLHAPSNSNTKGTQYVLEALKKLKEENVPFEYKLIQNMPNEQVLKEYSDADILVGQLFVPGCGKQELEALCAGMVVLSSARREYPQLYQANSPLIDINPDSVYAELKKIIYDWELRKELAKKGRPFVEQFHDPDQICKRVLNVLNTNPKDQVFDYYPSFFRDEFVPESKEATEVYNKWTDYVKDCDWYKKYIKSGTRNGLTF